MNSGQVAASSSSVRYQNDAKLPAMQQAERGDPIDAMGSSATRIARLRETADAVRVLPGLLASAESLRQQQRTALSARATGEAAYAYLVADLESSIKLNDALFERALDNVIQKASDPQLLPDDRGREQVPDSDIAALGKLMREVSPVAGDEPPLVEGLNAGRDGYTHSDFYKQLIDFISRQKADWLNKNTDALAKFTDFYTKLTTTMAKIEKAISGVDDKGLSVDFTEMKGELDALFAEFNDPANGLVDLDSRAAAQAFIDELGLPGMTIREVGGRFVVMLDLGPLDGLIKSMVPTKVRWHNLQYAQWTSARDTHLENYRHISQVLGEKVSRVTQLWDTLVKLLSSTIDSITEADKSFINGL